MLGRTGEKPAGRQTDRQNKHRHYLNIPARVCEKNTQYMHLAPPPLARTSRYQYRQLQGMGTPFRLTGASTNTTLNVCVCYLCLYLNLMSVCVVCQYSVTVQRILCKQHVQAQTETVTEIKGCCTVLYCTRTDAKMQVQDGLMPSSIGVQ